MLLANDVQEVGVADTTPAPWFVVTEADGVTVRNLTGFCAYLTFWYPGSDPHMVRGAAVDGVNGTIKYVLRGDEYTIPGDIYFQWTIFHPDSDDGAAGRGYYTVSGPIIRRTVLS